MSTRKIVLTATAVAALAAPGMAQARQGADDPVGHVRHSGGDDVRGAHHTSSSKATAAAKAKAKAKARARARARGRHGRGRGSDDGPGHVRHGNDDGPNHT
jgi:hypothetical protein